jgi:hypothetical protein
VKRVDYEIHGYIIEDWEYTLLNNIRKLAYDVFAAEGDKLTAIRRLYKVHGIGLEASGRLWAAWKAEQYSIDD